ncbi:MAG: zf-HC2 domain-containing protein, partial [Candidatus Solibacter sp.]|nr:zf-HC2 domain-containing protein [Candidatus Solibacter sp.]
MSVSTSGPSTCEDVRQQLSLLVAGNLDAERRGRLHGHLASCADCAAELAGLVAVAMMKGAMPRRAGVQVEKVPSLLYPARRPIDSGKVGMMWQRGTSCGILRPEDRRAMDRARRELGAALERSRRSFGQPGASWVSRGALRTRGGSPGVPEGKLTIEVLDATWESIAGAAVPCELFAGPEVSADGVFRLGLEICGKDFEAYRGRAVICTITAGEEKISFEARLTSPRVEFAAHDLPKLPSTTPLVLSWLRLYLA